MEANALTHHGILGMKWGVRRFQNKDGTLTKAGKKRYADDDDDQKENNQSGSGSSSAPKTKSVKDMTDDEIFEAIARAQLEDRLTALRPETSASSKGKSMSEMSSRELAEAIERKRLETQYQSMYPKHVSAGEKFVKKVLNDVIAPAAITAGKEFATSALKKLGNEALGIKGDNKPTNWADKLKQQTYEKNRKAAELEDLKRKHDIAKENYEYKQWKRDTKKKKDEEEED